MKFSFIILILSLFISAEFISAQNFFAGAEGSYLIPVSGLADRFMPAPGYAVFFGKEVSPQWKWSGKLEYLDFDKINKDNYSIKRKYLVNSVEKDITLNLPDTTWELSIIGLSANADYNLMKTDFLNINIGFGFGVYRWESTIGSYNDSLYYTDETRNQALVEVLKIPAEKQLDWSGGFSAGVNIDVHLYGPLWFNAGANYKNIVGELWAILSLDMENISTFQMFQTKAGLFIKL